MNHVPCPYRIISETGDGFSIGVVLGTIWYTIKGSYYSIRTERFKGGLVLASKRAPILGGQFAMWAGLFSATSCVMVYYRQKEDSINSVVGGAVTGFILAMRGGIRRGIGSAIFGGLFLGVIEVGSLLFSSYQKRNELIQINRQKNELKKQLERSRGLMPSQNMMI